MDDTLELVVERKSAVADGIVEVILAHPTGEELPNWKPGAHITVTVGPYVRHYSLCGSTAQRNNYRIAVLRENASRGGSAYIHDSVVVGDRLLVGRPRNQFPLHDSDSYLFVAGGIGITALISMVEQVALTTTSWTLVYLGTTLPRMSFRDELEQYGDHVLLWPKDDRGSLDISEIMNKTPHADVYACGPKRLIEAIIDHGDKAGQSVQTEKFSPWIDLDEVVREPFDVVCSDSGFNVTVGANETMLEALKRVGIDVGSDCLQGTCGTCELDLVEGEVIHLDSILASNHRDRSALIFPCVSRGKGVIVVDI